MANIFASNPLLLLFAVATIGYLLGRIEIFGTRLGVASVLFVGLGFGAWDPRLELPELIQSLGLALFVYTVGLSCGSTFFATLRGRGARQNGLVVAMILFAACLTVAFDYLFSIGAESSAGVFAGALSNTPALAAVTEIMYGTTHPHLNHPHAESLPIIAFSITYPFGVAGVLGVLAFFDRYYSDKHTDKSSPKKMAPPNLINRTLQITNAAVTDRSLRDVIATEKLNIVATRKLSAGKLTSAHSDEKLKLGDHITVVGSIEDLNSATLLFGTESSLRLEEDRSQLDFRRILVSNNKLAGHPLADLKLDQKFGAIVTRIRRGDVEILPHSKFVIELGDRLRVVAQRADLAKVSEYFGDSEKHNNEVDVISLGLGIAIGLVIGLVSLPLPGGMSLRLGLAGGPMLAGLILGAFSRTGPILWSLPHGANLVLRQFGLVLFLAAIGTRAGTPFVSTLGQGSFGWLLFLVGAIISCLTAALTLLLGRHLLKLPTPLLVGIVAGLQTQPALLAYGGHDQVPGEQVSVGYTSVFPIAFILKIIVAQVIYIFLRN